MVCALFVSSLNESYIFYYSMIITLISNVLGCCKYLLHINYFNLKGVKSVAICKPEDSSADRKVIDGVNEQKKDSLINKRGRKS